MPRIKRFGKRKHSGNIFTFAKKHCDNENSESIVSPGPRPSLETEVNSDEDRPISPTIHSEPKTSSSKQKLQYLTMMGKKCDYLKPEMEEGNVVVDLEILSKQICNFVSCSECSAKDSVRLFEATEHRKGIVSKLILRCSECHAESSFMTSNKTVSNHFENNIRFVYGLRSIGKGHAAGETLCSVMNLPQPPTKFHTYNQIILRSTEKVAKETMTNAARQAVIANDGCNDISVAIDGSWQKRGHTSLNGVVTITSLDSGKVLDIECLAKYCPSCKINHKTIHQNCKANYEGSSGGMEAAGVLKLFERSEQNLIPLRYTTFLGDGDSKAYGCVVDAKPYGDDISITKVECVGHIQKRMGTRLRNLRKKYKKIQLSDGKYLSGRGRLTDDVIDRLQQYYGNAIRASKTLPEMTEAVWATYFHYRSTDAEPQHDMCPIGGESWCKYNRAAAAGLPCPPHDNSLPVAVMDLIKPVYESLSDPNLLTRCLHGKTQNCNEAFNHLIWSRLPKTNFVTLETLKVGVMDAVICFNVGVLGKVRVLEDLCGKAGANSVIGLKKQDVRRLIEAEKAMKEMEKKARQAKRNVKKRLEDVELNDDNPSYGAGLF